MRKKIFFILYEISYFRFEYAQTYQREAHVNIYRKHISACYIYIRICMCGKTYDYADGSKRYYSGLLYTR